jgi:hypothetical protein
MSRARRKNRFPISLNQRLDRKLLSYSVAAGAAGVALLALAPPSRAQIVYTPTNQEMTPGGSLTLDVNNDGVPDFIIQSSLSFGCGGPRCVFQQLAVWPKVAGNAVVETYGANYYVLGLQMLSKVGPGKRFDNTFAKIDRCKATLTSRYLYAFAGGNFYLGLEFSINGQIHYGWARIRSTVEWNCNAHTVLTGYAYETIPGEPIRAGEMMNHTTPSATDQRRATLGALALGSVGVETWRWDETREETPNQH